VGCILLLLKLNSKEEEKARFFGVRERENTKREVGVVFTTGKKLF